MSQPDIPHSLYSADGQCSEVGSAGQGADVQGPVASSYPQVSEEGGLATPDPTTRIRDLENALDQSLACLADFKWRIQNQEFLEAQLLKTEEFASVQHQAIACLKQRLQQCEQELWVRDQMLLMLISTAYFSQTQPASSSDRPIEAQPAPELPKQLTLQLGLDWVGDGSTDSTGQLAIAQQQIQNLTLYIAELETELKQAATYLEERHVLELALRQTKTLCTERDTTIATLRKELAIAQIKVEELETQLAKQHKLQAKWQQTCQELELERDRSIERISTLERDVAEMQEQIFQQARQASEDETAIQHWKDRYLAYQQQIQQLNHLLEQAIPNSFSASETSIPLTPAVLELFTLLQLLNSDDTPEPAPLPTIPSSRFRGLDLPNFLIKRRNLRTK